MSEIFLPNGQKSVLNVDMFLKAMVNIVLMLTGSPNTKTSCYMKLGTAMQRPEAVTD
ncbi:protein of unknown function [Shewanella benthica]|uniref:Uncharacterized protein n=1 Tax=Shewanella benthica TaxID=43661 RepID=A0A330M601_9GAMM|nr:protein of unknown function [Shewanella benthica]